MAEEESARAPALAPRARPRHLCPRARCLPHRKRLSQPYPLRRHNTGPGISDWRWGRIGLAARIELGQYRKILIVALGKAAVPMTQSLLEILPPATARPRHLQRTLQACTAGPANPLLRRRPSTAEQRLLPRRRARAASARARIERDLRHLPHQRRRQHALRSPARSRDLSRRHHRLPPGAHRVRRHDRRDEHAAQTLLRREGRPPGDSGAATPSNSPCRWSTCHGIRRTP